MSSDNKEVDNSNNVADNNFQIKLKSILGYIVNGFLTLLNIAGFIVTIWTANNTELELPFLLIIVIVVFNSVILVACGIYETVLYFKVGKIKNSHEQLIKEKEKEKESFSKEKKNFENQISNIGTFTNEVIEFANQLTLKCNKAINENNKHINKCLEAIDAVYKSRDDLKTKNLRIGRELTQFADSMKHNYYDLLGDCTERLQNLFNGLLKKKNIDLHNSITIKQFNKSLFLKKNVRKRFNEIEIITAYRDGHAYTEGKREIARKKFSIPKNDDFLRCLEAPYHYLRNNITEADLASYANENDDFLDFYNSTIVVPIYSSSENQKLCYGYLACDTYNNNLAISIYDKQMVDILALAASIIGLFLNITDTMWGDTLNTVKSQLEDLSRMVENEDEKVDENYKIDFQMSFISMFYKLKAPKPEIEVEED